LLTVLRERGEASVLPAVLEQAGSSDAAVRVAALNALGVLGDTNAVPVLALAATSRERREREVAQQALASLRGDQVSAVMVAGLRQSPPELQRTLAQALSSRGERTVVPSLLSLARETDGETRSAALLALGGLVEGSDVDSLVQLIAVAPDLESKMDVVRVFEALAAGPAAGRIETAPIVAALARGDSATRQTLLQVCALFRQDALRAPFRAALHDEDERVRAAAALALCDTQDEALLPDLLEVARRTQDPRLRNLALEGVVRLASEESAPLTVSQRTDALAAALELAARAEDRRRVLSGLARVPDLAALRLTERATADAAVRVEAELACLQIAQAVGEDNFEAVATMLRRLAAAGSSAELRTQAEGLLRKFDSGWLVAGPYRQEGKECQELFDLPFPPERDDAQGVWRRLPGASRPRRPGVVDLASLTGGDHCVLYLQTRVYSPVPQAVTFSLGVDEGIKLWVNGELVHAHNTGRGLTPDQDRAAGRLRQGWNELRAKITHHTGGCSLLLRILDEDGKETPGLRQDPRGVAAPADCGFQRLQLADEFYTEGAYWADFNRDGKLDVVAGPFWFAGPEFKRRHAYREVKAFSPRQYSDNFLTYAGDVNRDGWVDILCVPFPGREGYWCENPGDGSAPWRRHLYARLVGNESPVWADVTGDGWPELVFNVDGYLGYAGPDPAAPTELWPFVAISAQDTRYQRFTHGVGCGDINGDGRADIVERVGWWEQPAVITPGKPWTFHPFHFADAAAQILIYDVNGDGARDLITTWHCHKYGLLWYEQVRRAGRAPDWKPHVILPPEPDLASSELRVSQLHAFDLADMNGDGLLDVVTGKRFWAHGPAGDPEPNAPAVLYWFELRREGGRAEFIPHLIDDDSGVGTQVTAADLNGDTRPDVVVGNKKGVFIHFNQLAHRAPGSHPSP
jgi:HEAT repeat protein